MNPATAEPWGFDLWKHLHDEHGLTVTESELQEIVLLARRLDPVDAPADPLADHPELAHKVGDRVLVLSNIQLGNLIGTVKSANDYGKSVVYEVDLDGGGTDLLFGFQLQPLPEPGNASPPADGSQSKQQDQ